MKRGGEGVDYIRKTVDKADVLETLRVLEARAERLTRLGVMSHAEGMREVIDMVEHRLGLLEAHPSRGWASVTDGGRF